MRDWDKKQNKHEKKLQEIVERISIYIQRKVPRRLNKIDSKIRRFVQKHCITLTFRQWFVCLITFHLAAWVLIPYFLGNYGAGYLGIKASGSERMLYDVIAFILMVILFFLAFSMDKGDDDDPPDDPPNDDGGITLTVQEDITTKERKS